MSTLTEIARTIRDSSRLFLTTHINPDGDAIGSVLALNCVLTGSGKEVTAFIADSIPANFRFLPSADRVINTLAGVGDEPFDLAIVLDSTDWERTEKSSRLR